jgi:hypothetical protein
LDPNHKERKLADHAAGAVLTPSVTVVSSSVTNGKRTVVLTRPLKGATKDHYTFVLTTLSVGFINAVGSTPSFGYHKQSSAATLSMWPSAQSPACVCSQPALPFGQGAGMLKYLPTGQTIGFPANRCAEFPRTELLKTKNPTCDLRSYVGGLMTCHHGWNLLDAGSHLFDARCRHSFVPS